MAMIMTKSSSNPSWWNIKAITNPKKVSFMVGNNLPLKLPTIKEDKASSRLIKITDKINKIWEIKNQDIVPWPHLFHDIKIFMSKNPQKDQVPISNYSIQILSLSLT